MEDNTFTTSPFGGLISIPELKENTELMGGQIQYHNVMLAPDLPLSPHDPFPSSLFRRPIHACFRLAFINQSRTVRRYISTQ